MSKSNQARERSGLQALLAPIDARPLVRGSRFRFGRLESRGVPAILCGVATIVLAAGAGAALKSCATVLPETLREAREFWLSVRRPRPELAG